MTQTSLRFFTFSAVLAFATQLHAIETPWNQICQVAGGNRLTIATTTGEKLEGSCLSTNADEQSLKALDGRVVKIARSTLARIDMLRTRNGGRHLESLGKGLHWGLGVLFSPLAPLGLVVVPPILAYDAVAAPFCWIGDMAEQENSTEQITVI